MQAIAREFNYSETTFVLPPEDENNTRKVRIFTPMAEIPFAGHPNVGTAVALARLDLLGEVIAGQRILFEEGAGVVSLTLRGNGGEIDAAEFIAPVINRFEDEVPVEEAAKALGLPPKNDRQQASRAARRFSRCSFSLRRAGRISRRWPPPRPLRDR